MSRKITSRMAGTGSTSQQSRKDTLDGYTTPPSVTEALLEAVKFRENVWEPAAGYHAISDVLIAHKKHVISSDIKRWTRRTKIKQDFLTTKKCPTFKNHRSCDIITNPPFVRAAEFAEHALKLLKPRCKLAMILKLQFLEGQHRKDFFAKYPPKYVYVFSGRIPRMHQFGYKGKVSGSILAFAWFIWEKGYKGEPVIRWL